MAERPIITEAQARAECRRVGIVPDDWRQDHGQERVYVWQDVQREMQQRVRKEPSQ